MVLYTKIQVPMTEFHVDVFVGGTKEERQLIQKNRYGLDYSDVKDIEINECSTITSGSDCIVPSQVTFVLELKDHPSLKKKELVHELWHLMWHIGDTIGDFRLSYESHRAFAPMIEYFYDKTTTAKYEQLEF